MVEYTSLLDGYVKAGHFPAARALLAHMRTRGLPLAEKTATVLLDMHARTRNFQVRSRRSRPGATRETAGSRCSCSCDHPTCFKDLSSLFAKYAATTAFLTSFCAALCAGGSAPAGPPGRLARAPFCCLLQRTSQRVSAAACTPLPVFHPPGRVPACSHPLFRLPPVAADGGPLPGVPAGMLTWATPIPRSSWWRTCPPRGARPTCAHSTRSSGHTSGRTGKRRVLACKTG